MLLDQFQPVAWNEYQTKLLRIRYLLLELLTVGSGEAEIDDREAALALVRIRDLANDCADLLMSVQEGEGGPPAN